MIVVCSSSDGDVGCCSDGDSGGIGGSGGVGCSSSRCGVGCVGGVALCGVSDLGLVLMML